MKKFNLQTAIREAAVISLTIAVSVLDILLAFRWHGKASVFFALVALMIFVFGINHLADHLSHKSLRLFAMSLAFNMAVLVALSLYLMLRTIAGFMHNPVVVILAVCLLPLIAAVVAHEHKNLRQYGTRLYGSK